MLSTSFLATSQSRLVNELRKLGHGKTSATSSTAEHVTYATLLAESKAVKAQLQREKYKQEQLAHQRHLQDIHDHQDVRWRQIDLTVARGSGVAYDEAVQSLLELREVAEHFKETRQFQEHFRAWVQPHLRRPALLKRLVDHQFSLPQA